MKKPLVGYPSSSEEDEEEGDKRSSETGKRRTVFTSLGIAREGPQRGDWLCHVRIPLASSGYVDKALRKAQSLIGDFEGCELEASNFHVSLTRPLLLRQHECDRLVTLVRQAVQQFTRQQSATQQRRTCLAFTQFALLTSEDDHTLYVVAEIGQGWSALRQLTTLLDATLHSSLRTRMYYEDARFHTSFAHFPAQRMEEAQRAVDMLNTQLADRLRRAGVTVVDQIEVAIGQEIYQVSL